MASKLYHSFIKMDQGHVPYIIYLGVMQQYSHVQKKKIHAIDYLRKRLMQTWFDFEQDVIDAAAIDQ